MATVPIPVWFTEHEAAKPATFHAHKPKRVTPHPPPAQCKLEYLNEGGANFVFRILHDDNVELPSRLRGKLLRLRKNLPHVPSAEDQLSAFDASFRDLFPAEHLIQHELILLDQSVPVALNANLQCMTRPSHRAADFLSVGEMSGLLVTDMTPAAGNVLVELKPKWLTQSPNAPPDAKRCRTCALRAQRASEKIRTATDAQGTCPFDLISSDSEERERAAHATTTDQYLREYLVNQAQPLFYQLRICQLALDQHGVLNTTNSTSVENLCKAMTLRDCTLFLRRSGNTIEARLGDLDLKQPEKLGRWKDVESALVDDGWYTNTEHGDYWTEEKTCSLSRS